jgi:DNA ligase-associated metallophosphoesterase
MNRNAHVIHFAGEPFHLLPQKAVYRPEKNQLIVSDVHLGKATHFRKMGIAMPDRSHLKDLDTLHYLLRTFRPETFLLLGDLFHSDYNNEWLWFRSLLLEFSEVQFVLIEGNHDILPPETYAIPNLARTDVLNEEAFLFSHHPLNSPPKLNICGHLHTGLHIHGMARQSIKLPCFYLDESHFILPAFGNLTGLFLLEQQENASYFVVAENRVLKL